MGKFFCGGIATCRDIPFLVGVEIHMVMLVSSDTIGQRMLFEQWAGHCPNGQEDC